MNSLHLTIFEAGYCLCPEHIALRGGAWRRIRFPAMFALLEHPRAGLMLFDTGYSSRFFEETARFPNRLYRWATPVTLRAEQTAVAQLARRGVRPGDIERVFISHFHADHVAALRDFPRARYAYWPGAFEAVRYRRGLQAVARAYLPGLLSADFVERSAPLDFARLSVLPPEYAPFKTGLDVLGDQSLLAVELPGHAAGQLGLLAREDSGRVFFFVADASWSARAIRQNRWPHPLANLLFADSSAYRNTLHNLHLLQQSRPEVIIVPSHCEETLARYTSPPGATA